MKRNLLFVSLFVTLMVGLSSCEKQIDQIKANAVVDIMVASKWEVRQYLSGTNDLTTEFAGYEFQFFRDSTVVGTKGSSSTTGTWSGDASTGSITATFPNSTDIITLLNGTWGIYSYDSNGPKFNQTIGGVETKLILKKK